MIAQKTFINPNPTKASTEQRSSVGEELAERLQREGVAEQDWSYVYLRAHEMIQTGRSIGSAVRQAVRQLHGMTRLDRDLLMLDTGVRMV